MAGVLATSFGIVLAGDPSDVGIRRAANQAATAATTIAGTGPTKDETQQLLRAECDAVTAEARFLEARLAGSSSEVPALALDLSARSATIELRGVPMRSSDVLAARLGRRAAASLCKAEGAEELGTPFTLLSRSGTLPPDPIPLTLDDLDALQAAVLERDSPAPRRHLFTLRYDRNLTIKILARPEEPDPSGEQSVPESGSFSGRPASRELPWPDRVRLGVWEWFGSDRTVILLLDPADAVVLYRSLPVGSGLALRL